MNAHVAEVQKWLETAPARDAPRLSSQPVAASWEAWADAGKRIEGVEPVLVDILVHGQDAVNRAEAAMALGFVGGDASIGPLIGALKKPDVPLVVMEAAASLGRLGRVEAVDPLCEALANPDINVRANASTALGNFKNDAARACLARAAKDPNAFVRSAAEEALRRQIP